MADFTEDEAYRLINFLQQRVFGWSIVIGMKGGRTDRRSKEGKLSDRLLREAFMLAPRPDKQLSHLMAGRDPELLWPESHRDFIRFCLWHRVPRAINEPLNDNLPEDLPEGCGPRLEWPDFIRKYDKPATLADMPEPPPPSEEYKAFENRRSAK